MPDGCELKEIDYNLLPKISGNIVLAFSWIASSEFLSRGKGFIMKNKVLVIGKAFLWSFFVLLFPIASGVLSVILELDTVKTFFLQGFFMVLALVPPVILVLLNKWHWDEIGFTQFDLQSCKRVFFFIPVLAIFIPVAVKGFYIKSIEYVLGSFFLYMFVGIAEEVYFRGIVPNCLKKAFSMKETVVLSTFIFGIGHIATAFAGGSTLEIILTVLNAFIFGWLAMEITILSKNIVPAILIHFFFDFETKIVAISGKELLIAEGVRGTIMFLAAIWLTIMVNKENKNRSVRV